MERRSGPASAEGAAAQPLRAQRGCGGCSPSFSTLLPSVRSWRSQPRPGAGSTDCDIGAYEFQSIPAIDVEPTALDFGQEVLGQTGAAQTVTLEHTGIGNLNLGTLSLSGCEADDLVLVEDLCSGEIIAPEGQCIFEITPTPSATGERNAQLDIPSDAPSDPDAVPLVRTGVTELIFQDRFEEPDS